MRIVKLSDLSEDEKKKVLEEQQARIEANNQARQQLQQNANNKFDYLINRIGDFNNNSTTWNQVQNVANNNLNRFNNINNTKNLINNLSNNSNNSALVNYVFNSSGNAVNRQRENKNMLTKSEDTNKNQTIYDVMHNKEIKDNKDSMLFSEQDNKIVPMKESNEGNPQVKNKNIIQDITDIAGLTGLGISTGSKEVLNYVESANENIFSNYKNLRRQQFLTSPNVSEDKKAIAKTQDNLLLQKNGINIEDRVETNLVKKAIRDSISKDEEEISKRQSRISNKGMQKLGELAPSMGQMIPGTIASAVNPILGTAYFTSSSGGSYINDALNKGMNEEQAFRYGTIMGALEGASESFITGQQVNKISKAFNGKQIISQKLLDSYGFNIFENAVQEAVMEPAQELTAMITGGSDKADWSDIFSRMAESGFNGGLMGAITNGVTYGLEKSGKIYNKIKNGENVTANEYKEALQENIEQFGKETVEENIRQGAIETYQELNNVSQREDLVLKTLINGYQENSNIQNAKVNQQTYQNNVQKNNEIEQVKIDTKNFSKQVDDYVLGNLKTGDFINVGRTPKVLQDLGVNNNPIILKQSKLKTILQDSDIEGSKLHGLSVDTVKKLPQAIANPLNVLQSSTNENSVVVITDLADKSERPIIASIELDYKGQIGNIEFLSNRLTSAYGKNNYDRFMQTEIEKGNLLYDIDEGIIKELPTTRLQSPKGISSLDETSSFINNSITPSNENVKPSNYSMQNQENNSQLNTIANNQNSVYNNGESEGGINEQLQQRGILERNRQETRIYENGQHEEKEYTRAEYEQWEQSIKPIKETNITIEQKSIKNKVKGQYNKDIVFFSGDNNGYSGGVSYNNPNKINIDIKQANTYGLGKMIYHEVLESDILNNKNMKNDIIEPAIEKIINDPNFETQKSIFWEGQEGNMPSDYLIAKDILCDRFSEIKTGESLDYKNVLSQETNMTLDYSLENFHKQLYGKGIEDLNLPTRETIQRDNNQQTPNLPVSENMKQRKHYKSIMESPYTSKEAKSIAKELMGTDTYVPESNKKQLARADERISIGGADSELNSLMSRAMTGGNIKSDYIAVGERLIQYYSKSGDKAKLQDAIQATAMAGTSAGQTVQALSLLNHQTPEGQAIWIQRSVEKMNNDLRRTRGEKAQQFDLTPDMIEKIVNSKNTEELQNNVNEVYEELGQQVSKTVWQKIDSWRYFSMLFNIRTHLRNVIGNTAMGTTQRVKNKTAGIIEGVVSKVNPEMERTHTIVPASKEVKQFAKNDIVNVADRLGLNDNKYNPKSRIENSMRTFKSDIMENTVGKMFNFNDKTLEAEDGFGLKMAYKNALSEYMTANKLTPENITDEKLSKARNYAIEQAKEATFHQESKIASLLNQLSNKNKFAKATMDATLPFKKTPINVAKSGLEYSPVGLIKSIVYDSVELRKGNITANKYIDNISKGLTGTGIALVGYALADMGILKASGGDDDKKEKYDEAMGNQTYAITIGDKTYSLDWLAPSGIPLFIGAELKQIVNTKAETKTSSTDSNSSYNQILETGSNLLNAFSNAMNPMAEMSMLSGLTSALQSYEQGSSQMFAELGTNAVKSYVNQYVPTVLGQVAKTTDDYERSTTSTKTGVLPKAIDTTKNQIMSKIPGLRQMLPVKTDIWGNDVKQNENIVARSFENGVLPWTEKKVESNKVNDALNDLYDKIGESSIYPKNIEKTFTINGEKNRLTTEEYSKYQKSYGQTSYKLINNLVSSKEYKNMNDLQKQKAIEEVYSYAKEKNKIDYAKKINKDVEKSALYKTLEDLKANGGSQSDYLNYTAKIEGVKKDKEKNEILSKSNYSSTTKSIIYKNTTGSEDDLYNNILSKDNIDINQYLNYKLQEFESDKEDDGTLQGKSVSGTKKKKVYEYVNNMNISRQQKMAILGTQYKLNKNEQKELYSYIDNISNQTKDEKIEIFKKYSSNFIINKNGTLTLK